MTTKSDLSSFIGRNFWGTDNSKLATNETLFSVISRMGNIMASLPIKLHRNYEIENTTSSDTLLHSPNQNQTSFEFIRALEVCRNETGNGYAVIERDIRGQVSKMTILDPTYVEPVIEADSQDLWYKVMGHDKTYYFHNLDMIHVKHIVGSGGVAGINPIKVLSNTLEYDKAVREFSLREMEGASNSFVLKYDNNVDEGKKEQVVENFKRFYRENGGVLFQEPGIAIDPIERQYVAADTFTSERITRSRVANVFNLPVTMLNDTEGQSFSSNEELMRSFVQMTLIPIVRQYEQEINRKVLTIDDRKAGLYFKFNVGGLLRGDVKTRSDFYHRAIRDGWMPQDEVRMYEDLPPMGGLASQLWISGDMYPLEMDPRERRAKPEEAGNKEED
nr:phage portal protein [Geomicrobium sp. JCM 19038]